MKRALKACLEAMQQAESYQAWSDAAKEYDRLSGNDEWREEEASPHYDYKMIRLRSNELKTARQRGDVNQLVFYINEGLHGNLGRIANPALYQQCFFGTKNLITDYLTEVCTSLEWVCDTHFDHFSLVDKLEFFERTEKAFGQSALMLSGGASMGMFHLGILRALWETKLLPNIISGSSAGSIMASVVGTHNDDELKEMLDPEYVFSEAFRMVGWRGTLRGKGILDPAQLELCLERNVKDLTFEEAYELTGRRVNITVSPADPHQESRLLNSVTSPHVLLRKASLASCAIPYIYPPVMLWAKNINGEKVPFIPSRQWVDGSIKNDLPIKRLSRIYGVNHTIVSQTNPHVVPFLFHGDDSGNSFSKYLWRMWVNNTRYNINQMLDYAKNEIGHNRLALLVDKAHSIVSQRYVGDINVMPPRKMVRFTRLLSNATQEDVALYIRAGETLMWPKLEMIRNTTRIGRTINECLTALKVEEGRELDLFNQAQASA